MVTMKHVDEWVRAYPLHCLFYEHPSTILESKSGNGWVHDTDFHSRRSSKSFGPEGKIEKGSLAQTSTMLK
jgi:hypothetical protein